MLNPIPFALVQNVVFLQTFKFFSYEEIWRLANRLSHCGNSSVEAIGPVSSTAQWAVAAITIATIATSKATALATTTATTQATIVVVIVARGVGSGVFS
jgi:hypothetical protein